MSVVSVTGSVSNIQEQFRKNATISAAHSFADTLSLMAQAGVTPSTDTLHDARKIQSKLEDEAVRMEFDVALKGSELVGAKDFDAHFATAQEQLELIYSIKSRLDSLTVTLGRKTTASA